MFPIWVIISLLLSFLFLWLAGYCSAVQDAIKHFPNNTIFNKPEKYNTKTKFGIDYEYYWNLNGKDSDLAKYINYRIEDGKRKTKILKWYIHMVQFYDAWHHHKMLKIGFNILADVTASVAAVRIYILHNPVWWHWVLIAMIYFTIQAINWNVFSFNPFYEKWLRKKVA